MSEVCILLATYNGELFIEQQIDSIIYQTYKSWYLIIHDDGSTDKTIEIVKRYQERYPHKISLIEDGFVLGSAMLNFSHLLDIINPGYIMFCDQDDIWFKNKIELSMYRMLKTEINNPNKPIIIHTDLTIVDENLNVVARSMFRHQRLLKSQTFLETVVRNNVTGCTMLINAKAYESAMPLSGNSLMHDWWFTLKTLSSKGIVEFVDEPTMFYRQHCSNTVGANKFDLKYLFKKLLLIIQNKNHDFEKRIMQAQDIDSAVTPIIIRLFQLKVMLKILLRKN